eukprot:9549344-Karenia_brevis.AAC.1
MHQRGRRCNMRDRNRSGSGTGGTTECRCPALCGPFTKHKASNKLTGVSHPAKLVAKGRSVVER